MMSARTTRKFSRVWLAATLGMAMVIGCAASGARAAGEEDDDALLDTKTPRGTLKGLGLRRDEVPMESRERSPLVLPPRKGLPPPEPAVEAAKKTANWPDDPDVKAVKRKKQAERDRKPY